MIWWLKKLHGWACKTIIKDVYDGFYLFIFFIVKKKKKSTMEARIVLGILKREQKVSILSWHCVPWTALLTNSSKLPWYMLFDDNIGLSDETREMCRLIWRSEKLVWWWFQRWLMICWMRDNIRAYTTIPPSGAGRALRGMGVIVISKLNTR